MNDEECDAMVAEQSDKARNIMMWIPAKVTPMKHQLRRSVQLQCFY